jgi:integrase
MGGAMSGAVEKYCGCAAERWPKCPDPWYLKKVRHQGIEYAPNVTRYARVVLARDIATKTEAEAVARIIRDRIYAGTYVPAKEYRPAAAPAASGGLTLEDVAARFVAARIDGDAVKRDNSRTNDKATIAQLCAATVDRARGPLGTLPIATLTIADLIAWRAQLSGAVSTWNKRRTVIGQLFRWAAWQGHIAADPIETAPADLRRMLRRGKAAQRRRRLDDLELANLLEAAREMRTHEAGSRLWAILVALLETGCRIGELLALQWADVHLWNRTFDVRALEVGAGKTGTPRTIEISQPLYDVLVTLTHDPAGQVFPRKAYVFGTVYGDRIKSIDKAFTTAVLRAHNVEPVWVGKRGGDLTPATRAHLRAIDLHVHDLRHEAACRWHESGAFDLAQIQLRLGHTTLAQTATYVHAAPASVKSAQAAYDAARGGRIASEVGEKWGKTAAPAAEVGKRKARKPR